MVIDASAALAWLLETQATPAAIRFLEQRGTADRRWEAPFVFAWEVDNTLLRLARAERLSAQAYDTARSQLDVYRIRLGAPFGADHVVGLAQASGLSLFDAAYLDHALENGCELASRDHDLLAAASRCGVTVHDLSAEDEA
ncbi:MAG: type II toxin-antitoxin system VapC family toxin [Caulobacteraceae bacterium]|nr:type II toxin-antitoxin system VapC family toxin [Caulobacter sp.]